MYNWQPFRGKGGNYKYPPVELKFNCESQSTSNKSVVIGDNTEGKSSLWDAFYFALYGHVPIWSKNQLEPIDNRRMVGEDVLIKGKLPLLNMIAFKSRDYYFGVKLEFEIGGKNYTIVRYCDKTNNIATASDETMQQVLRITDSSAKEEPDPQKFINSILPETIAPFTLFDGEKLEHYRALMMDEDTADVRGSIERITRLTMFRKGIDSLGLILKRAVKTLEFEQKAHLDKGKQAKNATDAFDELQEAQNDYDGLMEDRQGAYDEKMEIENALLKFKDQKARLERIRTQERIIGDMEKAISKSKEKLKKCMSKSWILVLKKNLDAEYEFVEETIRRQTEEAKIQRDYEKKIQSNLDQMNGNPCAECERPREEIDSKTRQILRSKNEQYEDEINGLEIARLSPNPEYLWAKKGQIKATLDKLSNRMPEAKGHSDDIIENEGKKTTAETAHHNLVSKNVDVDEGEIDELDLRFKNIMKKIGVFDENRKRRATKKDEAQRKWNQYGGSETNVDKKSKSFIEAEKRVDLTKEMIHLLEKSMAPYREKMRKKVQKKTNTLFLKLTNQEMYEKITVTSDFKIKLHHAAGVDQGSTGQNALVSYALTLALSECSGIDFPMIIDTPFRSLGQGIKIKLLPYLLSQSRQIILIPVLNECMSMAEVEEIKNDLATIHIVKNVEAWHSTVNELHRRV